MDESELKIIAKQIRMNIINTLHEAKSGHPGASLSIVELLTVLFFHTMKKGDKFVLSKGHAVIALYSVFAELGLIEKEELNTYRKINSRLQGHPDMTKLSYLDAGTGALGQGLSIAIGYALGMKLNNNSNNKVFCIIGDGECQEGQIWESAMYYPTLGMNNLVVIIDKNNFQNEDSIENTLPMPNLEIIWKTLGWNVIDIDGHDIDNIKYAFLDSMISAKPTVIIAHTIKGKGIDFMENVAEWHSKVISDDDYKRAIKIMEG